MRHMDGKLRYNQWKIAVYVRFLMQWLFGISKTRGGQNNTGQSECRNTHALKEWPRVAKTFLERALRQRETFL
jgi:hypothetical protein